ncbi:MAG: hypothetical protein D6722_07665 [Bacteroidetes bacterium]|nr:MAG: hypothetical protein D6722_07665 [Bacteroidota bacterium]
MVRKLVLGLAWLWLMGCGGEGRHYLTQREACDLLITQDKTFMRDWTLAQIYDPYAGGTVIQGDSLSPRHLVFFRDGHFLSYDRWNYSDGTWLVRRADQKLALIYDIQNSRRIPTAKQDTAFRYRVSRPAADTLILGIQGRHGMVRETYRP